MAADGLPPAGQEILDSDELAAFTGTKASTWRYWASIGQGPASFKLGRRRVWLRSTVEAWIAEQAAAATTANGRVCKQVAPGVRLRALYTS